MSGYDLKRLVPGSYDLLLDGEIVGSVVRSSGHHAPPWRAELLLPIRGRRRSPQLSTSFRPFRRLTGRGPRAFR
jgi:hypothetical protein